MAEQADLSYTYRLDEATNRLHHSEGDKLIRSWQKLTPPNFPTSHFKGSYYSEEIDHQILLQVKDGKLTSENPLLDALRRVSDTIFLNMASFTVLSFQLNDENEVMGFRLDIPGGDRNLRNLQIIRE